MTHYSSSVASSQRAVAALSIAYLPIGQLKPDPGNARLHSAKQVRQITKSIETFGFNVPLLIDAEGNVIAGHGRLLAAKRLGWDQVPAIRLDHLSETQKRAFMIADNRLAEVAVWDDQLLAEQLRALASVELNFDIETIGFDMGEIDLRIEALGAPSENAQEAEPTLSAVCGPPVSRTGDLWLMGRHKVLCGDARDEQAHGVLLGSDRASMVFTDPPYNVAIDGHVSGLGKVRHREFIMASGEMTREAFAQFLTDALRRLKAASHPGSLAYVCMDWAHMGELLDATRSIGLETINLCVWTKPNAGMGGLYRSQHELVFVFKLGSAPQQCPARRLRAEPIQRLGLCGWTWVRARRRGRTIGGFAPDGEAHRNGRRRHSRRYAARRHSARSLSRQRHDFNGLRADRTALARPRTRSPLCRCNRAALAGLCRRVCSTGRDRAVL